MNNTLKKIAISSFAIIAIAATGLSASTTKAEAGWGKKKFHHFYFKSRYYNNYDYNHCTPKFRPIWVWSPYHGRKIKKLVKVGKWCGGRYYDYR